MIHFTHETQTEKDMPRGEQVSADPITSEFALRPLRRSASKALPSYSALWSLVESLGPRESFWIEVASTGTVSATLTLAAGLNLDGSEPTRAEAAVDTETARLKSALRLALPCFRVGEDLSDLPPFEHVCEVPLRGFPVLTHDLSGEADPQLLIDGPSAEKVPCHVVLGAFASVSVLTAGIWALDSLSCRAAFRLSFQPRLLAAKDLRRLSDLYGELSSIGLPPEKWSSLK